VDGEDIDVIHVDPAHTDGDSIVYFRKANIIHSGDTFMSAGYPFIDLSSGGTIEGFIHAADHMLASARPIPATYPATARSATDPSSRSGMTCS
jgi:cyclase